MATFLAEQTKYKLPNAPIFSRSDGRAWDDDAWKQPIKDAARLAKLPSAVAAYTLRHCVITDLIRFDLPALMVAQLSGTSVTMIDRHYGQFVKDDAERALASLAI